MKGERCSVPQCPRPVHAKQMCANHYKRMLRWSAPLCRVCECDRDPVFRGYCAVHRNLANPLCEREDTPENQARDRALLAHWSTVAGRGAKHLGLIAAHRPFYGGLERG